MTTLALTACGSSTTPGLVDGHGPDGGRGDDGGERLGGGQLEAGAASIEGSFDLAFTSVTFAKPEQVRSVAPSMGAKARVDIRKGAAGYDAVVTPRWGVSSAFMVAVDADAVTLTGGASIEGSGRNPVSDAWQRLVLARASGGGLAGTFRAVGVEREFQGDMPPSTVDASGEGTVDVDTTPPEARNDSTSSGPADALLPWDPVVVDFAEPIVLSDTPVQLTAGPSPLPVSWSIEPPAKGAEWVGSTRVSGLLGTWDVEKAALVVSPVKDRVGLTSAATTTPLAFLAIPLHTGAHRFDGDVKTVAAWGPSVAFYGGRSGSDTRCEHGCVAIGPRQNTACDAPHSGIAGRIEAGAMASSVVIRYRVLVRNPSGHETPTLFGLPFASVDAASPSATARATELEIPENEIKPLATPIDVMTHATDWRTLRVDAPTPSTTLGFNVTIGVSRCELPPPPSVDVELLVDSVSAQ